VRFNRDASGRAKLVGTGEGLHLEIDRVGAIDGSIAKVIVLPLILFA